MSRKAPQGPPRADSEDLGRAVGELLHDTLVAVEKSLAAAGRTLRRHTERLDGQCERLGVHERRERERLNAIEKRLSALGRGDAGEAKGEAEKPAGSPEPISQAWVFRYDGETFWDTLVPGGDWADNREVCLTKAKRLLHPATVPVGQPVLVNLVPVEPRKEPTA